MKSKRIIKKNNNHFPHLPEEEINKLVEEMTDSDLLLPSQNTEDTEEELLLIKVLNRKLKEGKIKAEMTNDGKLWLKTTEPVLGGTTQIKYKATPYLEKKLKLS